MKQYDIAVVIGRFQPIHKGHIPAFQKAEQIAHKTVCVIGSVNKPSTPKNPFSFEERVKLISDALFDEKIYRDTVDFVGVEDTFYREQEWYRNVKAEIQPFINEVVESNRPEWKRIDTALREVGLGTTNAIDTHIHLHGYNNDLGRLIKEYYDILTVKIAVLGYEKDESSYYLNNFSDWKFVEIDGSNGTMNPFSATFVRKLWFENDLFAAKSFLHKYTYDFLTEYEHNDFLDLQEDYNHVKKYDNETQVGPFPVQFLTTDAVVIHGDEVLLIRRGMAPGKGQWALPGGFVDKNETFFDSSVRELREETRISVPEKVIRGSKKDEHMFDFPKRSSRGRTVSMAYLFVLDASQPRPRVKGGDDAVMAWWFSLSEVEQMRDQMYEDHTDIIEYMTARI